MVLDHARYRERSYFPALDGLRAVSILLVLVFHADSGRWWAVHGWLGVQIFFVISGYLITTLALREEERRGAVSLRAFYTRRACRILPLYYLVLAAYVVLVGVFQFSGHAAVLWQALPFFLFYMNEFAPDRIDLPFPQSWSLGVEEKFYLVWPVLAFVLWRRRPMWRFLGTAALVLLPPLLDLLHLLPFSAKRFGVSLYGSYDAILVGGLLAFGLHHERSYRWLAGFARGVPAVLAFAAFVILHVRLEPSAAGLVAYAFTVALVMIPVLLGEMPWTRPLATRPMIHVGVRAYGIYLVHMMVFSAVHAGLRAIPAMRWREGRLEWSLVSLAVTVLVSWLAASALNAAVERPLIALGRRWTRALTGSDPDAPARMEAAARS